MAAVDPTTSLEMDLDQDDGVEPEQEEVGAIKRPFNPEKIKIRTVNVVADQIVSRIDHDEIDLAPEFQRMAGIWNHQRKSRLIESLLLRIPIPVFYVAADDSDTWSVVDGVQRTSTIYGYVKGDFKLTQLEYLTKFDRLSYEELPRSMQRRIQETQLVVNVIEPGTPEEVMFNIFRRINTGGMTLNGQEIPACSASGSDSKIPPDTGRKQRISPSHRQFDTDGSHGGSRVCASFPGIPHRSLGRIYIERPRWLSRTRYEENQRDDPEGTRRTFGRFSENHARCV